MDNELKQKRWTVELVQYINKIIDEEQIGGNLDREFLDTEFEENLSKAFPAENKQPYTSRPILNPEVRPLDILERRGIPIPDGTQVVDVKQICQSLQFHKSILNRLWTNLYDPRGESDGPQAGQHDGYPPYGKNGVEFHELAVPPILRIEHAELLAMGYEKEALSRKRERAARKQPWQAFFWCIVLDWWERKQEAEAERQADEKEAQAAASSDPTTLGSEIRPRRGQKLKDEHIAFIQGAGHAKTAAEIIEGFKSRYGFSISGRTVRRYRNNNGSG